MPFLGPILGPLIAAQINANVDWRWTWYVLIIWTAVQLVLLVAFVPETYAPKLLKIKAAKLRRESGNQDLHSSQELVENNMDISKARYVWKSTGRPFELLLKEPMVFLLCLWCALLLGILYCFFSSFPIIFGNKGFTEGQIGLSFIGIGIGIIAATVLNSTYFSAQYRKTAVRLGRKPPPEEHLKKGMWAAVLGPISLFWSVVALANTSEIRLIIPSQVRLDFSALCSLDRG